jgi:hypothetical protein
MTSASSSPANPGGRGGIPSAGLGRRGRRHQGRELAIDQLVQFE